MKTIDQETLLKTFHSRRNFYQFLQVLFFEPISLEDILDFRGREDLEALRTLDSGGQYLYQYFSNAENHDVQKQQDEFYRLFSGPGVIQAPPWESVYKSRDHLLFGESTFQVRAFYHKYGLEYKAENLEPDDHLVIELEFMHYLSELCENASDLETLGGLVDDQLQFLTEHLSIWVPRFCQKVLHNTDSLLYKGAAILLDDFIKFDIETLKEMRGVLEYV